ncbi:MAG TPA: hypothetical protein VJ917_00060 [Saprospiraceae bacterium]|nr:hypothetical protein [Saprospiraceae bacterium]
MNSLAPLRHWPRPLRWLTFVFLLVLSVGYFTGLAFVEHTTEMTGSGIVENYNGNEDNPEAETMKFKKAERDMLNIVHAHILSLSLIFFVLAFLVYLCLVPKKLKNFLMVEPMISVLVTFGGIYLIWLGIEWISVVVMISGFLMTLSYAVSVLVIFKELLSKPQ